MSGCPCSDTSLHTNNLASRATLSAPIPGETAGGKFPTEAVRTMAAIVANAEVRPGACSVSRRSRRRPSSARFCQLSQRSAPPGCKPRPARAP
jgi:hypothetical protein